MEIHNNWYLFQLQNHVSTKYEIERLDCFVSFALWTIKMKVILMNESLHSTILAKEKMIDISIDKTIVDDKAFTTIHFCLFNEVLLWVDADK